MFCCNKGGESLFDYVVIPVAFQTNCSAVDSCTCTELLIKHLKRKNIDNNSNAWAQKVTNDGERDENVTNYSS